MSEKNKNKIVTILFSIIIILSFFINIIKKDEIISIAERRKLEQFPSVSISQIINGTFFNKFDKYVTDQFFERELFRKIKINTARKDEADLQEAFEKNELRNGCPILINKKRIKGSDVIMREFYTEIPEKIWDKRKNEIADSMNIHYVKKDKPFSHGKKANGRRIVMYSGVGREDPERGEIYDEQF